MIDKTEVSDNLRKIVKTSLFVFIGVFLSKVFTYLYRIIIARYLGSEIYGLFSLALMISGFFISFSSLGLSEGLLRYVSFYRGKKDSDRLNYIIDLVKKISLVSGLISGLVLFFLARFISITFFNNPELIIFLQLFGILIPIYVLSGVFVSIVRSFEKISFYSFINNILQNAVKLLGLIILLMIGLKTNAVIFSYILGVLTMLIAAFLFCKYKLSGVFTKYNLPVKEKKEIRKNLIFYSLPMMFSGIIFTIFYWIDTFVIGFVLSRQISPSGGAQYVGFYNAAIPIVALLSIVPDLLLQLFFPLITKEFAQDKLQTIKELSKQVSKWIFFLNLPLFLIMFFFPEQIIFLLFGEEYLIVSNVIRILSISAIFSSLGFIPQHLILMKGKSNFILKVLIVVSLFNLILDFILVPKYGMAGAALATMTIWIVYNVILILKTKNLFSFTPYRKKMLNPLLFLTPFIISLIILRKNISLDIIPFILLSVIFFIIYLFLLFITKSFDEYDISILKSIRSKIRKKH